MAFVFGDYTIETYKNLKTRLRCYDKSHELTESIVLYCIIISQVAIALIFVMI